MLCAVTILPADLRSLSLYYYAVCGSMCMSSVRVWFSCLLVIGKNSNGTKHSGGPPEDGREKRPKHVGVFILTNTFLTFYRF